MDGTYTVLDLVDMPGRPVGMCCNLPCCLWTPCVSCVDCVLLGKDDLRNPAWTLDLTERLLPSERTNCWLAIARRDTIFAATCFLAAAKRDLSCFNCLCLDFSLRGTPSSSIRPFFTGSEKAWEEKHTNISIHMFHWYYIWHMEINCIVY